VEGQGVSRDGFLESLASLSEAHFLREPGIASAIQPFYFVALSALFEFVASTEPNFQSQLEKVASEAVNLDQPSDALGQRLGIKKPVVWVILENLDSQGLLELWWPAGAVVIVGSTSVELRRQVRSGRVSRRL